MCRNDIFFRETELPFTECCHSVSNMTVCQIQKKLEKDMIQNCKTQHSFPREDGLVEGTGARITGPDSGIVTRPWARVLNFAS